MNAGSTADEPSPAADAGHDPSGYKIRPAAADELAVCGAIWRDALNDYLGRLAQPEVPDDYGPILRLYAHLHGTDPTTFLVAERTAGPPPAPPGERVSDDGSAIDAFVVVVRRERLAYLSMLFVRPGVQGRGLGRALLDGAMPDDPARVDWRATSTDSAQPISNGLYGALGMVPRIPLLRLVGVPNGDEAFDPLPDGVEAIGFDEIPDAADGLGRSALDAELASLDRDAAGFARAPDHPFHLREGRVGFLFRDRTGAAIGYGYTSEAGRIGPVAVRNEADLGPVIGHLVHAVRPRGAFGIWVPGSAGGAVVPLLRAGFRFDGFPVLLCWDRPFADFARYVPMSPGLL